MKHSISPYPEDVKIRDIAGGAFVSRAGKFLGEVQKRQNWGNDWLARPEDGRPNAFHITKTSAVKYLLGDE